MKARCLLALVVVISATAPAVRADTQSHRKAAEELFRAMNIDKQMESALNQTLTLQIKQNPQLEPYKEAMRKFFAKHISYEALKDDLVQIYVEEFTEEELRQILAFYQTAAGKKMVEKGPALMGKCMQLGMNRITKHEDELRQTIEAEVKKRQDKK
jgi:hypothetical protein